MSRADFERWEARYAARDPGAPAEAPVAFLLEIETLLPRRGRALELAGGAGRHALHLARRGLEVLLVDVSPRGLEIARQRARAEGLAFETRAVDLELEPLPAGPFELVFCSWYLLAESIQAAAVERLRPGGCFVYVHPTTRHLERHDHPNARILLEPGGLARRLERLELEVVRLEEGWDADGHHTARVLARRRL